MVDDPRIRLKALDQDALPKAERAGLMEQVRGRFPGLGDAEPTIFEYENFDPEKRTSVLARAIVRGGRLYNLTGHPIVNYGATYPADAKYPDGAVIAAGSPVLRMTRVDRGALIKAVPLDQDASYARDPPGPRIGHHPRGPARCSRTPSSPLEVGRVSTYGYAWVITDGEGTFLSSGYARGRRRDLATDHGRPWSWSTPT